MKQTWYNGCGIGYNVVILVVGLSQEKTYTGRSAEGERVAHRTACIPVR